MQTCGGSEWVWHCSCSHPKILGGVQCLTLEFATVQLGHPHCSLLALWKLSLPLQRLQHTSTVQGT